MARPLPAPASVHAVALLALAALSATPGTAQTRGPDPLSRIQYGVGYVANAPEEMLGGAAYVLSPRWGGIGIYVDAKFASSDPSGERGYDPSVTSSDVANTVGGTFIKTEGSWKSMNVAVLRPLTPSMVAYVGGGLAQVTQYDLYNVDPRDPIGVSGVVWAENPDASETRPNLMVGVLLRMTPRLTTQFGYETQPDGVTVGMSLRLPKW